MRLRGPLVLAAFLSCLIPELSGAFDHPQLDRGFDPDKLFQYGEVDQVSLRDGRLSVVIPVGQEYRLSERFSYRFSAAWVGTVWDYVPVTNPVPGLMSVPNRLSNAGWGWSFFLAQLRAPGDPSGVDTWRFIGPDGGEEEIIYSTLHACEAPGGSCSQENDPGNKYTYSRSGGYTRMFADSLTPNYREVHVRTGVVYEFRLHEQSNRWRLTRIRDPYLSDDQPPEPPEAQNWVEL